MLFESGAPDLVDGGTNGMGHIFLKDLSTGAVTLVSIKGDTQANNSSKDARFSADGHFVVFTSLATNLITGNDINNAPDIFLKNLATGVVTLLSTAQDGTPANGISHSAQLSPDGRSVLFTSSATNLVAGKPSFDIFIKDIESGTVKRLSSAADGTQANGTGSTDARFSPDGGSILFASNASNLVPGDSKGFSDIFLKDIDSGAISRLSTTADGSEANGDSFDAQLSADGRYMIFESKASNLVAGDTKGAYDIFRKDLVTGAISRLSTAADGSEVNGGSFNARVSPDGRYMTFESLASNLVAGDTNGEYDIFLKDLVTGAVTRLSTAVHGLEGDKDCTIGSLSPDGRYVTFASDSTNLVAGDTNNATDIFLVNLLYKANAAAILDGRFIETTLGVGNASSVRVDWGDDTITTPTPVAGQVSLHHAYATTGTKHAIVTLVEGALTWNVAHTVDLAAGTIVRNTALADTLTGGQGGDVLTGDAFRNILNGAAGNDRLDGGAGGDVLNGGAGDDTYVTDGADLILEMVGGGIDTVVASGSFSLAAFAQVENLTAADGTAGVMLTGNALANILTGNAGANRLNGGAGADVMNGGAGDDTYVADGSDTIFEAAGGGLDTVLASSSFSLAAFAAVENLTADGAGGVTLTGNALANVLTGNAGANRLSGGSGNDRLTGGFGKDNLTGGSGRDVFAFDDRDTSASKSKADYILDFSRRQSDRIDLKAIDANTRKSGDQKFSFIGQKGFSKAGELRTEKSKSATYVYLNTDNDRSAEAVIKIKGALDLQKGWFVL
ncbi:MAG TPA: hypothetical protein VGU19_12825 [Microvirga sp.]|nr:hypothetical protein [Microvirga sp.]